MDSQIGNISDHKRCKVSFGLCSSPLILGLDSSKLYHFSKTEIISFKEKNVRNLPHETIEENHSYSNIVSESLCLSSPLNFFVIFLKHVPELYTSF